MVHLHQTYEILTGGFYAGNPSWNKKHSEIDNCFKIYLLTRGAVTVGDGRQEYRLEQGGLYFVNGSKLSHQHCRDSFATHWLHFIPKDLIIHRSLLALPLLVDLSAQGCVAPGGSSPARFPDIELILLRNLPSSPTAYYLELLRAQTFLQTLIIALLEAHPLPKSASSQTTRRIAPVLKYINENFTEPLRLEHLAARCGMSPNHFHKIFSRTLNTSPMSYIALLRMNAALQLLIDHDYTVREIAYRAGYSDDAYFNRVFKKYYGMTPGQYRKRRGKILL